MWWPRRAAPHARLAAGLSRRLAASTGDLHLVVREPRLVAAEPPPIRCFLASCLQLPSVAFARPIHHTTQQRPSLRRRRRHVDRQQCWRRCRRAVEQNAHAREEQRQHHHRRRSIARPLLSSSTAASPSQVGSFIARTIACAFGAVAFHRPGCRVSDPEQCHARAAAASSTTATRAYIGWAESSATDASQDSIARSSLVAAAFAAQEAGLSATTLSQAVDNAASRKQRARRRP